MLLSIFTLLIGLLLLVKGAEILISSAIAIGKKLRVSEFFIGLIVVGFGTSLCELVVSIDAVIKESPDISVGNVIGSNIANIFLVTFAAGLTSELKSIKQFPTFNNEIDRNSLAMFLRFNSIPAPYSIYEKIYKLEPGQIVKIHSESNQIQKYSFWSIEEAHKKGNKNKFIGTSNEAVDKLEHLLSNAVSSQMQSDVPLGAFLSGGVDSSTIVALMQSCSSSKVNTFTIGFNSKDFDEAKHAAMVAKHIGTDHHSIILSKQEFLDAIPEVIYTIESYDTTTVRASVGNWLISKYIRANSRAKVVFNGDGSDEVTGGYMYFHLAENALEFDHECKRLLKDICYFDVLRSDRSISSHGLEARTPFLDKNFVQVYLSISAENRFSEMKSTKIEKYLLRKAFDGTNLLPYNVLWRTKEAFSDGVSTQKESWFETIQNFAKEKYKDMNIDGPTAEKYWYRELFNQYYPNCKNVIPYMWMPKFVEATDASARTLDIYKSKILFGIII